MIWSDEEIDQAQQKHKRDEMLKSTQHKTNSLIYEVDKNLAQMEQSSLTQTQQKTSYNRSCTVMI